MKLISEKGCKIEKRVLIRSDHGREFKIAIFAEFCNKNGITHEFSTPKTRQQNGIVERKNRTLEEMTRVMLNARGVPKKFWAEAINTACYTINRVYLRPGTNMTPYEIWKRRKPNLKHFHAFNSVLCCE